MATRDPEPLATLLEELSGESRTPPANVPGQSVQVSFVGAVELVSPLDDESGVGRFLSRRGPGLHHIAFRVRELERWMERLARLGFAFTSRRSLPGARGHRIAFIHPESAGGVLVELVEHDRGHPLPADS